MTSFFSSLGGNLSNAEEPIGRKKSNTETSRDPDMFGRQNSAPSSVPSGGGKRSTSPKRSSGGVSMAPLPGLKTAPPEDYVIDFINAKGREYSLKVPSGTAMKNVMAQFAAVLSLKLGDFHLEIDGMKIDGNSKIEEFEDMGLESITITMDTK